MKHINSSLMKNINTKTVLDFVRRNGPCKRIELTQKTGMTNATISNIVKELIEQGFVVEVGEGQSIGGRKPALIDINETAAYAVGLELTATELTCVLGDFRGNVVARENRAISVSEGRKAIIDQMVEMVSALILQTNIPHTSILGLGLAVPGPCDYKQGVVLNPPNFPDWVNVPIREIMSQRLDMDCWISKETCCDGLAEYWFGSAIGVKRVFAAHISTIGIGGSFIYNGEIYQAGAKESMDFGHCIVQADGFACTCGSRGCLEAHANGRAAVRYAMELAQEAPDSPLYGREKITLAEVIQGADAGDAVCLKAIDRCASYISLALRNVILLLAVDKLHIGGSFIDHCPRLLEAIRVHMAKIKYPDCERIPLAPYQFGKDNGAIGALALVFQNMFER